MWDIISLRSFFIGNISVKNTRVSVFRTDAVIMGSQEVNSK